jgi:hypothetical protein
MKELNESSPILNRYAIAKSNGNLKPVVCYAKTKKVAIKIFRENGFKTYWANVKPVNNNQI